MKSYLLIPVFLFISSNLSVAQDLSTFIKKEHPRIILTDDVKNRIIDLKENNTMLDSLIGIIKLYADTALEQDVIKYEFDGPDNPRLKAQRRATMFRIFNMGLMYRLTGDIRYANKIRDNLLSAARFPDWGPSHFLNIGEISLFMGIGYDWVYETLSPEEKNEIRNGIITHGLREGIIAYNGKHENGWWVKNDNNWNQVCNGGLCIAALSVFEDWADSSSIIIREAIKSLPRAMDNYRPDGAWYEGPTYWAYGTTYNGMMLDALETATDTLFGLEFDDGYESLGRSGLYHIQTAGPTGLYFNYADAKKNLYFSPVLFWLSRHFEEPVYAWYERLLIEKDFARMLTGKLMDDDTLDRFFALLAIWFSQEGENANYEDLPYDSKFDTEEVSLGAMRNGWEEESFYIAFKAGDNQANHGHLDIGTFVMDAKGERWAYDLSGGDYSLPGYFDFSGPRWQYYRTNNFSHNTLVMNNSLQNIYAKTRISRFSSNEHDATALLNMTNAYINHSYSTTRRFKFIDRKKLEIMDEMVMLEDMPVRWGMVTMANVEMKGNEALLEQNGKKLKLKILEPADARFDTLSTDPGDPDQRENPGSRMLAFTIKAKMNIITTILVEINPEDTVFSKFSSRKAIAHPAILRASPNPFSSQTIISLNQDQRSDHISINIYNLSGQKVCSLYSGPLDIGDNRFVWSGTNNFGEELDAGVYLIKLESLNNISTLRLLKMR